MSYTNKRIISCFCQQRRLQDIDTSVLCVICVTRAGAGDAAAAAALNGPADDGDPAADDDDDADVEVVPEGLEQDNAALKVSSYRTLRQKSSICKLHVSSASRDLCAYQAVTGHSWIHFP